MSSKTKVWLVQSSVATDPWMPLACGYLKATVMSDTALAADCDVRIFNFGGRASTTRMFAELSEEKPDVIGFSVLGWNYPKFLRVSELIRRVSPDSWIVWGGNHVANQPEKVFKECPAVDVLVNGEGEFTFAALLRARLGGVSRDALQAIPGISFLGGRSPLALAGAAPEGIVTTPTERIADLDTIPSPFLTGALPLQDADGQPIYPQTGVLLETNRGCPFKCSFCYWGGAIGQKVRGFSSERLREELDFLGRSGIYALTLCDANFGMIKQDEQFVQDLVATKEKHGAPQALVTAWGKNKSDLFFRVVEQLQQGGLTSNFILSLQSTSQEALVSMRRANMKINEWRPLVDWCRAQGLGISSELIWGVPGETVESFLEGFDEIAKVATRTSCYDLELMPNTEYWDKQEEFGIVARRGEATDYHSLLYHDTISLQENREMHRFLFWQRILHGYCTFRFVWRLLGAMTEVRCSEAFLSLDRWLSARDRVGPLGRLLDLRDQTMSELDTSFTREAVAVLYRGWPELMDDFNAWFEVEILPRTPHGVADFLANVFRFDQTTMPIFDDGSGAPDYEAALLFDTPVYLRRDVDFRFDVPRLVGALDQGLAPEISPADVRLSFCYPRGFALAFEREFGDALAAGYAGAPLDLAQLGSV